MLTELIGLGEWVGIIAGLLVLGDRTIPPACARAMRVQGWWRTRNAGALHPHPFDWDSPEVPELYRGSIAYRAPGVHHPIGA